MSLHALAGHMATKGRGSDSMLVHMTPEEVQSLQVLALKNGGSLTINPDTGLPEANFLKKLLPAIAGAALNFFAPGIGTAVGGLFGLGGAAGAGIAVGGITSLATGSLSRGLMAGLGAYGGASLGSSLAGAGEGALAAGDIAAQQAAGTFPTLAEGATQAQVADYASQVGALRDTALSKAGEAGLGAKMSAGFGQMASNPGTYAKDVLQSGLAAISPMMADQGVQTTTKMPSTGTIRNYTFDPYGQTYTSAGNYPASEYKGMAQGGIVALAGGGAPAYFSSNPDVAAEFEKNPQGLTADQFAQTHYDTFGKAEQRAAPAPNIDALVEKAYGNIGRSGVGTEAGNIDQGGFDFWKSQLASGALTPDTFQNSFNKAVGQYIVEKPKDTYTDYVSDYTVGKTATPTGSAADFLSGMQNYGISDTALTNALASTDLSNAARYSLLNSGVGVGADKVGGLRGLNSNVLDWMKQYPNATQAELGAAKAYYGYNSADVVRPYENGFQLTTGQETAAQKYLQDNKDVAAWLNTAEGKNYLKTNPEFDAADIAYTHYKRYGEKEGRTWGAPATTPQTNAPEGTTNPYGNTTNPGDQTFNKDGSITVQPNIPGRPYGGFSGMDEVKNAYTQGGGSLGYTNKAPTTMDEFNTRFGNQTGDSKAAYDYLMGKGANQNAYPTKSGVAQIMRPYSEVTMGVPVAEGRPTQKYIFQNGKYVENPNYRPLSYNSKGERSVGLTSAEVLSGLNKLKDPKDDGGLFDWATANNISEAQLAAALGISIAEARARIAAGKTKSKGSTANTSTGAAYDLGAGGGDSGAGSGASSAASGEGGGMSNSGEGGGGPGEGGWAYGGQVKRMALGGLGALAGGGSTSQYNLGGYSDGGRLLRGPGNGTSDDIPATIGDKQPARLADGEFVIPSRIVSELGNGSTEAGARQLYAMMDRIQKARAKTTGKNKVAFDAKARNQLPA